jgi:hypothetical protein
MSLEFAPGKRERVPPFALVGNHQARSSGKAREMNKDPVAGRYSQQAQYSTEPLFGQALSHISVSSSTCPFVSPHQRRRRPNAEPSLHLHIATYIFVLRAALWATPPPDGRQKTPMEEAPDRRSRVRAGTAVERPILHTPRPLSALIGPYLGRAVPAPLEAVGARKASRRGQRRSLIVARSALTGVRAPLREKESPQGGARCYLSNVTPRGQATT